jgi:hypothetical protein
MLRKVTWKVDLHDDFASEFRDLHQDVQDKLLAHIELLEQFGPQLGRPRADTLNDSRHANMKELRFDAADGAWRLARGLRFRPEPQGHSVGSRRQVGRQRKAVLPPIDRPGRCAS